MIDFGAQPAVKRATARLKAGRWYGTGYLVRPDRIATCHHVVEDLAPGAKIECTFGDEARETRTAFVDKVDPVADCALLRFDLPMTFEPLRVSDEGPPYHFWTFGFPAFTDGVGLSIDAELLDPDTVNRERHRVFSMYSKQFIGRVPDSIGGLSGSPVLLGGVVVGHMSSVLGSTDAAKAPHLGQAYAVRASGVLRLLGEPTGSVRSLPAVHDAGNAELAVANRARVFQEIEVAASGDELRAALERGRADGAVSQETMLFAGNRFLGLDLPTDAIASIQGVPESPERQQDLAVAYSLQGDHARAQALLKSLTDSSSRAVEGGIFQRRWLESKKRIWLEAASDAYAASYAIDRAHYPGINAAFCSLALGRPAESERIARELIVALEPIDARDAWQESSLAEAHLLAGDVDQARTRYRAAASKHRPQWRNLAIMRRQARAVMALLGRSSDAFDAIFAVPSAAAFTGHRVDDDETRGRLSPSRVYDVNRAIRKALETRDVQYGYSSVADGGDILFIEALLDRGAEVHAYLPFPVDAFAGTSVTPTWRYRFDRIIAKLGSRVVVLSDVVPDPGPARDASYAKCNDAIQATARRQAETLDQPPLLIAVVAGDDVGRVGSARDAVRRWAERGDEVAEIDPRNP